jgi:hypothetical protein
MDIPSEELAWLSALASKNAPGPSKQLKPIAPARHNLVSFDRGRCDG